MAAEVARVEYEMNLQANMRVPGAVPQIEVETSAANLDGAAYCKSNRRCTSRMWKNSA